MQNNLKKLVIISLVLGLVIAVKNYWPSLFPTSSPYTEKIKGLDKNKINKIAFEKTSNKIELSKNEDIWKINGKKADVQKIDSLIKAIFDNIPDIVSESDQRHNEFELGASPSARLNIDGKINIFIGKVSSSGGVYARFADGNNVYIIKNLSSFDINIDPTSWMDKTIFSIDRNKLKKLAVNENGITKSFIQKDGKWTDESTGKEPDASKMEAVILEISSFMAPSIPNSDKIKSYPENSSLTIDIESDGGTEKLIIYKGKDDNLLKRNSDNEYFTISAYSSDRFSALSK